MIRSLLLLVALIGVPAAAQETTRKVEKKTTTVVETEETRLFEYTRRKGTRVFLFVFDHSASTAENNLIETNKQRLRSMLETHGNNPDFQAGLIPFSGCYDNGHENDPKLTDRIIPIGPKTADRIERTVEPLRPEANTALADALKAALQRVQADWFVEVILYTDYADTCNGDWQGLLKLLQEQFITIKETQKVKRFETRVSINVMTEASRSAKSTLRSLARLTQGKFLQGKEAQEKFMLELEEQAREGRLNLVDETVIQIEAAEQRQREIEENAEQGAGQPSKEVQRQKARTEKEKN